MKERKDFEIKADIPALTKVTGKLISDTEMMNSKILNILALCDEIDGMWQGAAANQLKADTMNLISEIQDLTEVCKKTAKEYDFALSIYKENKQKTADIINAINI